MGHQNYVAEHGQELIQNLLQYCKDKNSRCGMVAAMQCILRSQLNSLSKNRDLESRLNLVETLQDAAQHIVNSYVLKSGVESTEVLNRIIGFVVMIGARDQLSGPHATDGLDFVMEQLVVPALAWRHRETSTAIMFGLQSFIGICQEYENRSTKSESGSSSKFNSWSDSDVHRVVARANGPTMEPRLIRHARKIGSLLSTIWAHCLDSNPNESITSLTDSTATDAYRSITHATTVTLNSIPRVIPRIACKTLLRNMADLIGHKEPQVWQASNSSLHRLLQLWPPLRPQLILAVCTSSMNLRDSSCTTALRLAKLICSLLEEWERLGNKVLVNAANFYHTISEEWAGGTDPSDASQNRTVQVALAVDSVALYMLCSASVIARKLAFDMLQKSHKLIHKFHTDPKIHESLSLLTLLRQVSFEFRVQYRTGESVNSTRTKKSKSAATEDQLQWSHYLIEVISVLSLSRPVLLLSIRKSVVRSASYWLAKRDVSHVVNLESIQNWRNCAIAVLCSTHRDM